MTKSPLATGCEPQTSKTPEALNDLLVAQRKQLKLTATLKRRALKNKANEKSVIVSSHPPRP